jgi:DNA-binding response OmpR family regulator
VQTIPARRAASTRGEYVLLVVEDPAVVFSLFESFSDAGIPVAAVKTVEKGLAAIRLASPGLVMLGAPPATHQARKNLRDLRDACSAPIAILDADAAPAETLAEALRILALARPAKGARKAA